MKVILIKDCKDGKINDVLNVKDGYGKNFLIKNGFAIPFNKNNNQNLQQRIISKQNEEKEILSNALKIKKTIEKLHFKFYLKKTNEIAHGSISKKQIIQELIKNGIKINHNNLIYSKINNIGIFKLEIKLYKDIFAKLKIEVQNG